MTTCVHDINYEDWWYVVPLKQFAHLLLTYNETKEIANENILGHLVHDQLEINLGDFLRLSCQISTGIATYETELENEH